MWRRIFEFLKWLNRQITYRSRLEDSVNIMMRRLIRLEILNAIERKDTPAVCGLYDEYKAIGGNSYITSLVEEYIKKQKRSKK